MPSKPPNNLHASISAVGSIIFYFCYGKSPSQENIIQQTLLLLEGKDVGRSAPGWEQDGVRGQPRFGLSSGDCTGLRFAGD